MLADPDADRTVLDRLMARFLRAVSFPRAGRPAYDDLDALFVDGAQLIRSGAGGPEISTLEEFVAPRRESVEAGALTDFEETEIAAITELFGDVAHRFSTYEKRGTLDGIAIGARGAISTQFVRTADGWRMSAMAWDDERPGLELPERYAGG